MPDVGSIIAPPVIEITGPLPPGYLMAAQTTSERARLRSNPYHPAMSNFLAVTGEHAAGGHPIAVMGCRVNGPGETDDADLGLWCGPTHVNLKRGSVELGAFPYHAILGRLKQELDTLIAERG